MKYVRRDPPTKGVEFWEFTHAEIVEIIARHLGIPITEGMIVIANNDADSVYNPTAISLVDNAVAKKVAA